MKSIERVAGDGVIPVKFISGRKNCHLKGLNSYVIANRSSDSAGMVRVFHNTGDALPSLASDGKFVLAPHNHRQDITITPIHGSVMNVNFTFDSRAPEKNFFEWQFRSAITDGGIATQYHTTGDLRVTDIMPIRRPLYLPSWQIHTVIASPGSAWLIEEGMIAPEKQKILCYSIHGSFRLSQDELYEPMTTDELEAVELCRYGRF